MTEVSFSNLRNPAHANLTPKLTKLSKNSINYLKHTANRVGCQQATMVLCGTRPRSSAQYG